MKAKNINVDSGKQEITNNIPGFPVSCYYSEFTPNTYDYIDWHWHLEFQLCMTISGAVIWSTQSQQTVVPAGEGIFINSQRVHMARPSGKEAAFFCVDFPPDFICPIREERLYENSVRPILEEAGLHRKVINRGTDQGEEILDILSKMAVVFGEKADGYEFELIGNVFKVWKRIRELLEVDINRVTDSADDRSQKILMFLQKNYATKVSLNEVADYIGLSRSECCRYFKKQFGQTISNYLLQYRIHKSKNLLTETDKSIAQVAQDCGFSDQSYYTRRFRELTGMTPKHYRLQQQEDTADRYAEDKLIPPEKYKEKSKAFVRQKIIERIQEILPQKSKN